MKSHSFQVVRTYFVHPQYDEAWDFKWHRQVTVGVEEYGFEYLLKVAPMGGWPVVSDDFWRQLLLVPLDLRNDAFCCSCFFLNLVVLMPSVFSGVLQSELLVGISCEGPEEVRLSSFACVLSSPKINTHRRLLTPLGFPGGF